MRNNLKHIENIEKYLLGKLSDEDKNKFDAEIAKDEQLKQQVENQRLVIKAIKRKHLKIDIKKVSGKGGSNLWLKIGGLIVVLVTAIFYYTNTTDQSNVVLSEVQQVVAEDYQFNGLKTWVTPTVQRFSINAAEGTTIEGENGTLIIVPSNAFLDKDGHIVKGEVDFELVEALTLDDMILYNLTTTADGKVLETGGMFYTNATTNGKALIVNPDRPLYIEIPTIEPKEGMMAFKGEITEEGNINWIDPIPLKKFLVRVDFEDLDFLPDGFEQRVKDEEQGSKFYLKKKGQIDSLYYTLLFNDETDNNDVTLISDSFVIEQLDEINVNVRYLVQQEGYYEEMAVDEAEQIEVRLSCGIDPLTVRSIRSKEFTNTFIATKEFEERIGKLHKMDNGEDLVQLYIHNLAKPMWEVDVLVAQQLFGKDGVLFDAFAAQKLTNLKDAEIYQDRLSSFYKEKKGESKQAVRKMKRSLAKKDRKQLTQLYDELNELRVKASVEYDGGVYRRINGSIAGNIPAPNSATTNVYATTWYTFGWANIDCYLKYLDNRSKEVDVIVNNTFSDVKTYQWLNIIRTLTPLKMDENRGVAVFPAEGAKGAEGMKDTYTISISRDGDQFAWSSLRYNPYEKDSIVVEQTLISLEDLKEKLLAFDQSTSPLVERLKTAEESLKEEMEKRRREERLVAERRKQLEKRNAYIANSSSKKRKELARKQQEIAERKRFEQELRAICFPCESTSSLNTWSNMKNGGAE
jgi:hypothetical protein